MSDNVTIACYYNYSPDRTRIIETSFIEKSGHTKHVVPSVPTVA